MAEHKSNNDERRAGPSRKGPFAGERQHVIPSKDVADPHPSTEEDYDKIPHPGGANPPKGPDIGPNSYAHDGTAPPRPKNKGAGPE